MRSSKIGNWKLAHENGNASLYSKNGIPLAGGLKQKDLKELVLICMNTIEDMQKENKK